MDRKQYETTVYNQIVLTVTSCSKARGQVDKLLKKTTESKNPKEIRGRIEELRHILKSCCSPGIVNRCIIFDDSVLLQWTAKYVWGEILLEMGGVYDTCKFDTQQVALLDKICPHKKTEGEKQQEEHPDFEFAGQMYTFDSVRKAKRGDIYRFDKNNSLNIAACTHAMERPVYKLKEPDVEIPLKEENPTMLQRSDKKTGPVCFIDGYEVNDLKADLDQTYAIYDERVRELNKIKAMSGQDLDFIKKKRNALEETIAKLATLLN